MIPIDASPHPHVSAPAHLTPAEVDTVRTLLCSTIADLRGQLREQEALVEALADAAGDDESGRQRETALVAADRAREAFDEAQDALRRLDAGIYGLCESCGRPIQFERLEAIPEARHCVECPRPAGFFR